MRVHGRGGAGSSTPSGWPVNYYGNSGDTSARAISLNGVDVVGFALYASLTFAHISFGVFTADGVNLYDVGIYNAAGALQADIGPTHLPSNTYQTIATVQGAVTLAPGLYLFARTGNANTAQLYGGSGQCWVDAVNVAASVGGQLPASIPAQAVSPAFNGVTFALS